MRGMFSTLAVLLFCMGILAFVIPLASQGIRSSHAVSSMIGSDTGMARYAAIGDQLRKIGATAYNITVSNNTVELRESFPVRSISQELEAFRAFEQNYSDVNVSMETGNLANGTFLIIPSNVTISHAQDRAYIVPSGAGSGEQVAGYVILLNFPAAAVDSAGWETISRDNGSGGLPVRVHVQDATYSTYLDFYESVSRTGTSRMNITKDGALVGYVVFSGPSAVEIYSKEKMDLKALAEFRNEVRVETGDLLSVRAAANKTARLRVA